MHGTLCLALVLALQIAGPPSEDGRPMQYSPDASFVEAFGPGMDPAVQKGMLERIVKESPNSQWADDALWCLGELARQAGRPRHVAYYWQYLMAVQPEPKLEEFTHSLPLFARSGVPQVEMLLRGTGQAYVHTEARAIDGNRVLLNAKPVSAARVLVWAGLGQAYEQMGRLRLAQKSYAQAQACAPAGGQWRATYAMAVERIKARIAARGEPPVTESAVPAPVVAAGVPQVPTNTGGQVRDSAGVE